MQDEWWTVVSQLMFGCAECKCQVLDDCTDRSPGDISDDDDVRDYQDFSSNDDLSDIDASDERPSHFNKLHATRLNFSSQVCFLALHCLANIVVLTAVNFPFSVVINCCPTQSASVMTKIN